MSKYFTLLTDAGAAAIANAAALGTSIAIETVAVGDGGGAYYAPAPSQTALRREVWRGKAASVETDPASPNIVVVHAVVPPGAGGFAMREIGVFNAAGVLLAVGNMAEQHKAAIADGMSSEFHIRMELAVSHTESIQLTVDPYLILATKQDIQKHDLSLDAHGRLFDQVKKKLDSIPVYEVASQQEAVDGSDNSKIMTPLRVKESVAANAPPPDISGAIDARLASQQEAEAGTDDLKLMTSLRVKQSVMANVPVPDIDGAISARVATVEEALQGTNNQNIMTPYTINRLLRGNSLALMDPVSSATGVGAIVIGSDCKATEQFSIAIGHSCNCEYPQSIALGVGSIAKGPSSFFWNSSDRGMHGLPEGNCTGSALIGWSLTAGKANFVIGKYNKIPADANLYGSGGDLFVIGNGMGPIQSNAFRVEADGGVYGTRSYTASGADYAEYFEWLDQNPDREDRRGRFVTLNGDKIRLAEPGDNYILGVISATPSVIGDGASDDWDGKYQRDIFGEKLLDENGAWLLSPQFKLEEDNRYVPREKRPEWAAVGMMGKLVMIDDGSCQVNGFCQPGPQGIAAASETGYRVIARLDASHIKIVLK